ncbi:MAG: hypothetical protein Tsb0016_22080 [Sphingomonadales bacterium]
MKVFLAALGLALLTGGVAGTALAEDEAKAEPAVAGNPEEGAKVFRRCMACHTLEAGGRHRVGPNLHGIFSRTAGTAEGFKYSNAMKSAGFVWDAEKLDQYITKPNAFMPGNRMPFAGLPNATQRQDLIAYLQQATQ